MSDSQQAPQPEPLETPPPYSGRCQCDGCGKPGAYTVVLCFWAIDDLPAFRGPHNAVRMFPAIVACEEHKLRLREVGFYAMEKAHAHVPALFKALSRGEPDLAPGRTLIDARSVPEALRIWQGHATPLTC